MLLPIALSVYGQSVTNGLLAEGKVWTMRIQGLFPRDIFGELYAYEKTAFRGDTVIDGYVYKREFVQSKGYGDDDFSEWSATPIYLREDGLKVYEYNATTGKTRLFLDFGLQRGDSVYLEGYESYMGSPILGLRVTAASDTVFSCSTDRNQRKCVHVQGEWISDVWVEGLGSLQNGIMYSMYVDAPSNSLPVLMECSIGDEILYKADTDITNGIRESASSQRPSPSFYDLQGRRMPSAEALKPGIYVKQGRKVLVSN